MVPSALAASPSKTAALIKADTNVPFKVVSVKCKSETAIKGYDLCQIRTKGRFDFGFGPTKCVQADFKIIKKQIVYLSTSVSPCEKFVTGPEA